MAKINDVIQFTDRGWAHLGKMVVVSFKFGRKYIEWTLRPTEGEKTDSTWYVKTLIGSKGLEQYGKVVGTAKATAEKGRKVLAEREDRRTTAALKASTKFERGDIVTINNSKRQETWDMLVMEIDFINGKIRGVNADRSTVADYGRSKLAWASLTHPDVKVTLKVKQGFDPLTDPRVVAQKERQSETAAKRASTKSDRRALRSLFGRF